MLSIHAFGVPRHPGIRIAETLGAALQLTNILRDVKEDAALQRLYVPLDMLARHGVAAHRLDAIFAHPGFAEACAELADLAHAYYAEAERLMADLAWRQMRPPVLMMAVYRETLDRLRETGLGADRRPDSPESGTQSMACGALRSLLNAPCRPRTHIVGAGLAGLATAVALGAARGMPSHFMKPAARPVAAADPTSRPTSTV